MRPSRACIALCSAWASACGGSTTAPGSPDSHNDTVEFSYDWPHGASAMVDLTVTKSMDGGAARTLEVQYRLDVSRTLGLGVQLLKMSEFSVRGVTGRLDPSGGDGVTAAGLLGDSRIVDEGRRLFLDEPADMRAGFIAMNDALVPAGAVRPEPLQRMVDALSTNQSLRMQAANTWRLLVGNFINGEFPLNQDIISTGEVPAPLTQDLVEARSVSRIRPSKECDFATSDTCMVITSTNKPTDPEQIGHRLTQVVDEANGIEMEVAVAELTGSSEHVLEADTMLPKRLSSSQQVGLVFHKGDRVEEKRQVSGWKMVFHWR